MDAIQCLLSKHTPASIYRTHKRTLPSSELVLRICEEYEMDAYSEFLRAHFKITEKSRCSITTEKLQIAIQNGWICVGAFSASNELIGTVISRPLGKMVYTNRYRGPQFGSQTFENVGYIDFFCVHPEFQKKNIGSELLHFVDAVASQQDRQIHFFTKEMSPLYSLPPIYTSQYIVRINPAYLHHYTEPQTIQAGQLALRGARQETLSANCMACVQVKKNEYPDTKIYYKDIPEGRIYLAVTDLHHCAKARELYGGPIGEIVWTWADNKSEIISDELLRDTLESMYNLLPYEVLLADKNLPHFEGGSWQKDAPYFLYAYNFNPKQFFTFKPWFLF